MIRRTAVLSLALLSVAALDGCRRKVVSAPTPVATNAQSNADSLAALRARQRADSIAAAERAAREAAAASDRRSAGEAAAVLAQKVYFDYDRDNLRDDARATLDAKVPILIANPSVTLAITGHTDERGTAEYNLALGQRRAAAAKRFLTQRGIDAGRIDLVSFGEERPTCTESREDCWRNNRRDEFTITVGTIATTVVP
jgi:peptidoglycan-associated lipoprotein